MRTVEAPVIVGLETVLERVREVPVKLPLRDINSIRIELAKAFYANRPDQAHEDCVWDVFAGFDRVIPTELAIHGAEAYPGDLDQEVILALSLKDVGDIREFILLKHTFRLSEEEQEMRHSLIGILEDAFVAAGGKLDNTSRVSTAA